MPIAPDVRRRLAEMMEARLLELGLRWQDVAERGNISLKSIYSARTGPADISPRTQRGIEDGLRWAPHSVQAIIDGDEPEVAPPAPEAQVINFPGGVNDAIRRTLDVQRILGITIDPGDEAVQELLRLPLSPEQAAAELRKLFRFRAEYSAGGLGTPHRQRR